MKTFVRLAALVAGIVLFSTYGIAYADQLQLGFPGPLGDETGIPGIIQNVYVVALGLAGALALGSIIYGAVMYSLSKGNPSKLSDAWDRILQAFIGVLLLVGAGTLLSIINPGLLNLQLPSLGRVADTKFVATELPNINVPSTNTNPTQPITTKTDTQPTGNNTSASCYDSRYRQLTCGGAWTDNASQCTTDAPHLCSYDPADARCQCSVGTWKGLIRQGNLCVCFTEPGQTDTANKLKTCVSTSDLETLKCADTLLSDGECTAEKPMSCYYPVNHSCFDTCGGAWTGLLNKSDGSCSCI